jgi:hypothetical protein
MLMFCKNRAILCALPGAAPVWKLRCIDESGLALFRFFFKALQSDPSALDALSLERWVASEKRPVPEMSGGGSR